MRAARRAGLRGHPGHAVARPRRAGRRCASRGPRAAVYELDGLPAPARQPAAARAAAHLVSPCRTTSRLVVVHTLPGAASAVALAIDHARLPECWARSPATTPSSSRPRAASRRRRAVATDPAVSSGRETVHGTGRRSSSRIPVVWTPRVLVRILTDDTATTSIACHADVGEARDHEKLTAERAKKAGAVAVEVVDAQGGVRHATSASPRCRRTRSTRASTRSQRRALAAR